MATEACPNEGCEAATTGQCLEGFTPLRTCPYLQTAPSGISSAETTSEESVFVSLPSGEGLTESEASEVTRVNATKLILLAGPKGSGKTTIVTSLYEAFLDAPFGNYLFAGSWTLVGFERRCFDGRIASGRERAHTVRTSAREPVSFLHLRLMRAQTPRPSPQELLVTDVSGELFREMRDSTAAVKAFTAMRRADHFCIIVDGEKLVDPGQRYQARTEARSLLRSVLEAEMLSAHCQVDIVFSKWDLVVSEGGRSGIDAIVEETKIAFARQAGSRVRLRFHEVAARPESKAVPFAHGLPTLLRAWLEEPEASVRARLFLGSLTGDQREMSRYIYSVVASQRLEAQYDIAWI